VVHGKGSGSICGSVKFLISYSDSLRNLSQGLNEEVEKVKERWVLVTRSRRFWSGRVDE
jgi:hypothetical protein